MERKYKKRLHENTVTPPDSHLSEDVATMEAKGVVALILGKHTEEMTKIISIVLRDYQNQLSSLRKQVAEGQAEVRKWQDEHDKWVAKAVRLEELLRRVGYEIGHTPTNPDANHDNSKHLKEGCLQCSIEMELQREKGGSRE